LQILSILTQFVTLNYSILLHCVDETLRFAFFFAIYMQRRLIFSRSFLFIFITTCFGLTGHLQVYRLFW
jgi:hypothetical protein